jgi:hypothetical protein
MAIGKSIINNLNMKKILLLFILSYNTGFAQSKISKELSRYDFNPSQLKSWDSIYKIWNDTVLWAYIEKQKINISDCRTCGFMYIQVDMATDTTGKCTYTKGKTGHCLKKMPSKIEKLLMNYFLKITFPLHLRNIIISERLGVYLRC